MSVHSVHSVILTMVPHTLLMVQLSQVVMSIRIMDTSPPSRLVEEGGTVSFLCQTDRRWFLCLWTSPLGDKQCAIQESEEGASQVCQGDPRIMVQGQGVFFLVASCRCAMTWPNFL